jgi:hypothetical protein
MYHLLNFALMNGGDYLKESVAMAYRFLTT